MDIICTITLPFILRIKRRQHSHAHMKHLPSEGYPLVYAMHVEAFKGMIFIFSDMIENGKKKIYG